MEKLTVATTNKDIIRLALPISVALFIPQASFFTNNIFMGMLGQRELGVNGITGVFYLILSMIGYGLSCGVQIQLARRAGEENKNGIAETFMNGVMLSFMFSLALMVLSMWLAPVLFSYSLNDDSNFFLSVNFMYIRVWGLPFLMLTQLLSAFYIAIGRTRLLIYGSLVATGINILFDYLLIFGKWGLPALGFKGAAVASVIAEVFCCIAMAGLFFTNRLHVEYPVLRYTRFYFSHSVQTLKVSAPLIVQFLFSIGGWLVFFFFIEHLGAQSLAASQMLRSIFGIASVGTWALATACNTMVSNIIGQGRPRDVMKIIFKISKLSFIYAAVLSALLLVFAQPFLSLYSSDATLISFAIPSLRVVVVATLVMAVSTVAFNGVVGTGNTLVNLSMEITCVGLYLVYCYYFIHLRHSALYVCWGSEFVYWISLLIGSALYLRSGKWKGKTI
ncbi:MAG: MATE family efflux transporter [Taibaiella sp.]|nr:MATE family efflux transporter [Taibaiella sp.]